MKVWEWTAKRRASTGRSGRNEERVSSEVERVGESVEDCCCPCQLISRRIAPVVSTGWKLLLDARRAPLTGGLTRDVTGYSAYRSGIYAVRTGIVPVPYIPVLYRYRTYRCSMSTVLDSVLVLLRTVVTGVDCILFPDSLPCLYHIL